MRSLQLLGGILLVLWLPRPTPIIGWMVLACVLPLFAWPPARRALPLLLLGALHAGFAVHQVTQLPDLAAGTRVIVEARIDDVPALGASGWQFDATVTFPRHPAWRAQRWRVRLPANAPAPASGELWQYALRFDPPRDARQRRLLLRDRVSAEARRVDGALNLRLAPAAAGLDRLRERLARRIADHVADPSAAALLAALAVGVTGEVSTRQWQVFNATGITHLVAISGMHVTFFAMLIMAAARRLWPWLARWRAMPRRELFAAGAGCLLALLYALLSGFSVPAQRTVVMLAAFLIARECGRGCTPAWSVAVALSAVLLFDPLAALSAGFWLSFLAVAAIVMLAGARLVPGAPLRDAVRVQWLVSAALLPATVAIFGSFSAVGLLANALAIPVFTFLLVPPVLIATACHLLPGGWAAWCGDLLVQLTAAVAAALWPFLSWCADLPAALWRAQAPLSWYLLAAPAALLAVLPVRRAWRLLSVALLTSVFALRDPRPSAGELWIDVPDRGRSAAVMLRTRERLLLWGTGESFGSGGRAFTRQLLPLLRAADFDVVHLWLPGNLTRDTQAALTLGAASMALPQVLLPPARAAPPEMQSCTASRWQWDGIDFELSPSADERTCLLVVGRGEATLRLGGKEATSLPTSAGETLRLVLDQHGLRQRHRYLRL